MLYISSMFARKAIAALSLLSLLLSVTLVNAAGAQTTSGTVVGRVFDEANQPVPGVKITITNTESGNAYAVVSDAAGTYRRPLLPPGIYQIAASKQGYTESSVTARVPLNATTEIRPPDITIRPLAGPTTTTQPTGQTPTGTQTTVTQTIAESESVSLVNRIDPTRGGNFTDRQLHALPLGGASPMRSFDELALLLPGVAPPPYTPGVRGPGVGFGIGTAGQFSVNGFRARSNNFTVDGSDNNDPDVGVRRQGFVALVPQPIESVQEYQVSTLLWNAELGRNMGSQVNAVSRGGSSSVHGQAYGFFTHNRLNARNAFDFLGGASNGEDPLTRVQAGFVIGGPLGRTRKTQFFGSYEFLSIRSATEQHFTSPTLAERRFLGLDTFNIRNTFNNVALISSRTGTTPIGSNVLSFYPLPNNAGGPFGANTYTEILPSDGDGSVASFRISHQFTSDSTLNGRYNFTDDNRVLPSVNRAIRSTIQSETRTQNLSLIWDSALSPTLFNQARFSFGRTRLDFSEYPGNPFVFQANEPGEVFNQAGQRFLFLSDTGPIGQLIIEPFNAVGVDVFTFPQQRANNTFQFADSMSWTIQSHSLSFGADIRRIHLNSLQDRNYRPQVVFNYGAFTTGNLTQAGQFTRDGRLFLFPGVTLASLGVPSSIFQTLTAGVPNSRIGLRLTEYNFFFNDNWKVRPNFTLDFGLRYEYNTVPREVNNIIEDSLALRNLPAGGANVPAAFQDTITAYTRILGGREGIYDPDKNNFGPHVGFAWDPMADGRMSIRAGYGIYYDTILGAVVSQSRNIFPNEIPVNVYPELVATFNLGFDPFSLFSPSTLNVGGVPVVAPGTLNQLGGGPGDFAQILGSLFRSTRANGVRPGGLAFTLPAKELRTPYGQQWHFTLEREVSNGILASAAYVGTKGTKLTRLTTPNGGPVVIPSVDVSNSNPLDVVFVSSFIGGKPIPELGRFQIFENSASSNYNSLQLELRKRYSRGYAFTLAYTWSHAIDDVSDVFPIAGAPVLPQDSDNLRLERGDANYDTRQRFSASLVWDLPFFRNSTGGASNILGGWQITSIFQAHTGQPFTLNLPFDSNTDGNLTDRPSTTRGLSFTSGHGSTRIRVAPGTGVLNFSDISFTFVPTPGSGFGGFSFLNAASGVIGRNTVRADGFVNLDLALSKRFRFGESNALDFRAEMFNALNRANYGIPVRIIGAPGFGSSYDTVNPARLIQFALKYSF
jgi:hypothetical protein